MISPTSYYGLLADELGLKWNSITLTTSGGDSNDSGSKPEVKPKKVSLSPDEPINEELSDVHVKHAARIISQKLRILKAAFDERHDKKTVAEYKGIRFITSGCILNFRLLFWRPSEGFRSNFRSDFDLFSKAFVQMMPRLNKERDYLTSHSEMCSKIISKPNQPAVRYVL